jgi:ribosomal-protein-alanine N-acetyltransferase
VNFAEHELLIRGLTVADLDRVTEIGQRISQAPHWPRWVYESVLDTSSPRRLALVAEVPQTGMIAGFAVAGILAPEAELESIAVTAEAWRQGVGRRLFSGLAGKLRLAGVREIVLEVRASNGAALGFYRSLGFGETGRRTRYYADPIEDAVLMGLRLR